VGGLTGTLARLNPLTPFALLLALAVAVSFVFDPLPVLALHVVLVAVLLVARLAPGTLLRLHLLFAPFAVGVFMTNAVSRPGEAVLVLGPLTATDEGVRIAAALALRVLVVAVPAFAVARATDPTRLVTALMTQLRLNHRAGFAVLTAHRLLAGMPEQWQMLLAAAAVRAPLDRRGRPRLGVRAYGHAAFGLLVGGIRRGERIADALEVRGVRTTVRTQRTRVPFGAVDVVAATVVVALAVPAVLVRSWWG
jgi:energy-coupling factor transport system permease protein